MKIKDIFTIDEDKSVYVKDVWYGKVKVLGSSFDKNGDLVLHTNIDEVPEKEEI